MWQTQELTTDSLQTDRYSHILVAKRMDKFLYARQLLGSRGRPDLDHKLALSEAEVIEEGNLRGLHPCLRPEHPL